MDATMWINIFTPLVTPIIVAGVKKLTELPKWLTPVVAIGVGALGNYLAQLSLGSPNNVWLTLALALAGIGVRELTKHVNPMTLKPAATLLMLSGLLVIPASAADKADVPYFKAGEFSVDLFGGVKTPDFDRERSSAGFGVNLFITENIGIGASTAFEDMNGSAFDNFSLRGIYRIPLSYVPGNQNAIYGFAGAQRLLNQGDWAGELGVGVERRWARHFGTFAEIGMFKELTGERNVSATGKVGVRVVF